MEIGMNKSDLRYAQWVKDGSREKGQEMEILINDKKLFPNREEVEINFKIFDGFAVGLYQGLEYVMKYPTVKKVETYESLYDKVRDYVGQRVDDTGVEPEDVALTLGEITQVRELPLRIYADDLIILMDADITHELAEDIIDKDVRKRAGELDGREMVKYFDIPETAKGRIEPGFFIVHKDGTTDYHRLQSTNAAILNDRSEAFNEYVDNLQNLLSARVTKEKMSVVSDYRFTPHEDNPAIYDFSCKIEGKEMPAVTLGAKESAEVHEIFNKGTFPIPHPGVVFAKYPEVFKALKTETQLPKEKPLTLEGLRKQLARKYPDGLTMRAGVGVLAEMLNNPKVFFLEKISEQAVVGHPDNSFTTVLAGNKGKGRTVETGLNLMDPVRVELHLKPEDYNMIYPDLACLGGNDMVPTNINENRKYLDSYAKADFNARLGDMNRMSFRLPKSLEMLERMTVNGQPLAEVRRMAKEHDIRTVQQLGEYMALDEIHRLGDKARVPLGALDQNTVRRLNNAFSVKEMTPDESFKQEAGYIMQEKGYMENNKENLVYTFFSDKRELMVPLAQEYRQRFPEVSMMVDDQKMEVSMNTLNPRCRQEIAEFTEAFLKERNIAFAKENVPFEDLSWYAKMKMGLSDGRTVDAYINSKGAALSGAMLAKENVYGMKYESGNILNLYPDTEGHKVLIHMDEKIEGVTKIDFVFPMTPDYEKVKDISLYKKAGTSGKHTEWMVRAKVNGEQQMGVALKPGMNDMLNRLTDNGKKLFDHYDMVKEYLAVTMYKDELDRSQAEKQSTGMKR